MIRILRRWLQGRPQRQLYARREPHAIVLGEETQLTSGPYCKDKMVLTVEDAQWLRWALEQLENSS